MKTLSIPLAVVAVVLLACSTASAGWTYVGGVAVYVPTPVVVRPMIPPPIPRYVYPPGVYPPAVVPPPHLLYRRPGVGRARPFVPVPPRVLRRSVWIMR